MNEVDQVEKMVRMHSGRPDKWWKRLYRRCVTHLEQTPTMKGLYLGAFFVAIGFQFVLLQLGSINDRNRADDQRATAQQIYTAKVLGWGQAVAAYQICLDGVARSDQNRAQWAELADIISALDTGNGNAAKFADQIRNGPLLSATPRTTGDCVNPGPPPDPPQ
jgi:hypothetical protein